MSQEEEFTLIPKIIHYCWFGEGDKPRLANRCIASWKRICPDYTIIEWNETNFDLDQHPYLRWCHDQRKWAFLSDFARLLIVWQNGGIYFDTDVELLRRPDELLGCEAFYGFENHANVATGLGFGAQPDVYKRQRPDRPSPAGGGSARSGCQFGGICPGPLSGERIAPAVSLCGQNYAGKRRGGVFCRDPPSAAAVSGCGI